MHDIMTSSSLLLTVADLTNFYSSLISADLLLEREET